MNPWRLADNPWLYFFFLALPMVVIVMIIFSFRRMMRNRRALSFLFFELLIAGTVVFDTIIGEVTFAYETADSIHFLASRCTLDESIKVGVEDAVNFLMKKFDISFPDAYRLMSATCDAQISEVVDDNVTIRIRVPKFDNRIRTL